MTAKETTKAVLKGLGVVAAMLLAAALCGALCAGCTANEATLEPETNATENIATEQAAESETVGVSFGMLRVGTAGKFHYYRDVVTDVMYLYYYGGDGGGLTAMQDPETGLPLTYERYVEMYEEGVGDETN